MPPPGQDLAPPPLHAMAVYIRSQTSIPRRPSPRRMTRPVTSTSRRRASRTFGSSAFTTGHCSKNVLNAASQIEEVVGQNVRTVILDDRIESLSESQQADDQRSFGPASSIGSRPGETPSSATPAFRRMPRVRA